MLPNSPNHNTQRGQETVEEEKIHSANTGRTSGANNLQSRTPLHNEAINLRLQEAQSSLASHPFEEQAADNASELAQEESDQYREDGYSETGSVLTLHLSYQENQTNEFNEESKGIMEELVHFTPSNENNKDDRARTAPPRPWTELEELRSSKEFINLESAAITGSQLIEKSDTKFDLDTADGQQNCKKFLEELEKLTVSFKVPTSTRKYRNKFSQAYKVLYKDDSLCYLTEILDSAQEGNYILNSI